MNNFLQWVAIVVLSPIWFPALMWVATRDFVKTLREPERAANTCHKCFALLPPSHVCPVCHSRL